MNKRSLKPGQRRTFDLIAAREFGRVEELMIVNGQPCFERPPRVFEQVKLDSDAGHAPSWAEDETLAKEFERLFNRLSKLKNAVVDVDVRFHKPFRLTIHRHEEL